MNIIIESHPSQLERKCPSCYTRMSFDESDIFTEQENMVEYGFVECPQCGRKILVRRVDFKTIEPNGKKVR